MTVSAVIFDWGGTLTPFHRIDLYDLWRAAAEVLAPDHVDEVARALTDAEAAWWGRAVASGRSGTTADVFAAASAAVGLDVGRFLDDPALHDQALLAHLDAWTPHTFTDPQAAPLLAALRERGLRTGLLSNTHWPREWHERWLARDGILDLLDGRVYTSDLQHLKPHAEAFRAALTAVSPAGGLLLDPAEVVFVGDRPLDDISGAAAVGMRTILIANSDVPGHPVEPDASITELGDVLGLVDGWR
ncbi:MAG TPA: HAD family hydrolase [Frankiaceae bacterium]|nr:HAD family hydrolase [Frankiaceae bacterium]